MSSPQKREELAQQIDSWVNKTVAEGGGDEELLSAMHGYMAPFKEIMDSAASGEMDALADKYDGFYRFAKLLEQLAGAIADGRLSDLGIEPKQKKPKGNGFR
ncbi:MAG: hypothetical protein WA902_22030 [Thermosynechococcaceae cyanobacterium]